VARDLGVSHETVRSICTRVKHEAAMASHVFRNRSLWRDVNQYLKRQRNRWGERRRSVPNVVVEIVLPALPSMPILTS
jgi:hypothetical protein